MLRSCDRPPVRNCEVKALNVQRTSETGSVLGQLFARIAIPPFLSAMPALHGNFAVGFLQRVIFFSYVFESNQKSIIIGSNTQEPQISTWSSSSSKTAKTLLFVYITS